MKTKEKMKKIDRQELKKKRPDLRGMYVGDKINNVNVRLTNRQYEALQCICIIEHKCMARVIRERLRI